MKIPRNIRVRYAELVEINLLVQDEVKKRFQPMLNDRWHFERRIKSEQSYAQKLESGRFFGDLIVEDLFACTIVVRDINDMMEAEKIVRDHCDVVERRPEKDSETFKTPQEFRFDDLRLYCTLKARDFDEIGPIHSMKFEVQIKTFLQHAWSIATHDLIYKSDDISWSTRRIAYQVKAMLEHAELAIFEAESLSRCSYLSKQDHETERLRTIIDRIVVKWPREKLPSDLVRLAESVSKLLKFMKIELAEMEVALDTETAAGRGVLSEDLSPYGVIVQTIAIQMSERFIKSVRRKEGRKKISIPAASIPGEFIDLLQGESSGVVHLI